MLVITSVVLSSFLMCQVSICLIPAGLSEDSILSSGVSPLLLLKCSISFWPPWFPLRNPPSQVIASL